VSDNIELQKIVGQVAAAYFSNSHVSPTEIPNVISQIASSLSAVGAPAADAPGEAEPAPEEVQFVKLTPAQIRKSIQPDALISFEDNRPYKTLRRHLSVRGLSPETYKAKWGLPKDYPMTAPSYSEARSAMAKALGLGNRVNPRGPAARAAKASASSVRQGKSAGVRGRKGRGAAPGGSADA